MNIFDIADRIYDLMQPALDWLWSQPWFAANERISQGSSPKP